MIIRLIALLATMVGFGIAVRSNDMALCVWTGIGMVCSFIGVFSSDCTECLD